MNLVSAEILSFPTPFRMAFKHSSAARSTTENVVVRVEANDGSIGYGEGCPRSYVTGETSETAHRFLVDHLPDLVATVSDLDDLRRWIATNRSSIDDNPAAFAAAELAVIDALARQAAQSVDGLLGLAELTGQFTYSAVLGDGPLPVFGAQMVRYRWSRLTDYKIKLSGDRTKDKRKVAMLKATGRLRLRVDANNHWEKPGECIDHLRALKVPLFGIEEPLVADDYEGFLEIAEALDAPIILDESLLRTDQLAELPGPAHRWTLNCRISKMGGLLRSLEAANDALRHGSGLVVGAHVGETSLLTRAALSLVNAHRDQVLAQEGAFGTYLLANDICDEPIMFGRGGRLNADQAGAGRPGFGVDVQTDRLEPLDMSR